MGGDTGVVHQCRWLERGGSFVHRDHLRRRGLGRRLVLLLLGGLPRRAAPLATPRLLPGSPAGRQVPPGGRGAVSPVSLPRLRGGIALTLKEREEAGTGGGNHEGPGFDEKNISRPNFMFLGFSLW